MNNIWIVKEYFDDYDQHGGYFLAAFSREPTESDLRQFYYGFFGRSEQYEYSWVEKECVSLYE